MILCPLAVAYCLIACLGIIGGMKKYCNKTNSFYIVVLEAVPLTRLETHCVFRILQFLSERNSVHSVKGDFCGQKECSNYWNDWTDQGQIIVLICPNIVQLLPGLDFLL